MRSDWDDGAAEAMVAQYDKTGIARDLALRVYTSRLLGRDKRLVLHGGGNTSLKTRAPDLLGLFDALADATAGLSAAQAKGFRGAYQARVTR